jgi:HAD superfamily hydrolase (TIGR01509 family)
MIFRRSEPDERLQNRARPTKIVGSSPQIASQSGASDLIGYCPMQRPVSSRYRQVIFDMDGTLTEELLDFDAIRRDIGLPATGGILEHITHMPPDQQATANAILDHHEREAADTCILHEGAMEILHALRSRGIKTALLTRNSDACAQRILTRHNLHLDFVATREHLPHKPHPDSVLNIIRHFHPQQEGGITPEQTLVVGDYLYDLQAAAAAGADSALLCVKKTLPSFADEATYCIRTLGELLAIVDPPKEKNP